MGPGGEGMSLEFTPTWVVAGVCTLIVAISLAVERLLHYFGTVLKKKKQKPLYEALQKVKEGTIQNPLLLCVCVLCEWVPPECFLLGTVISFHRYCSSILVFLGYSNNVLTF